MAEAELGEGLAAPREPTCRTRVELAIWPTGFLINSECGPAAIRREAEAILERVKADYGDVRYLNGMVRPAKTLAVVAERELAEIRTLSVGKPAPEISARTSTASR